MATKPLQVRIDPDLREELERQAEAAQLPISSFARHLIRMGLGADGGDSAALEHVWRVRALLQREMESISQEIARLIEERVVAPFREVGGEDED